MKLNISQTIKNYMMQFAELYYQHKIYIEKLYISKYFICSSLEYYKKSGLIQLAFNDKPGDFLPPMTISAIKNAEDIISGLHPVDVNSINDLYYSFHDKITKLTINEDFIEATDLNGKTSKYNIDKNFNHETSLPKKVSYLIGYIQAERYIRSSYAFSNEKYKIIKDYITTLHILNMETKESFLKTPGDILFSNDYQFFSKDDISRIAYICGQMSQCQSNDNIA